MSSVSFGPLFPATAAAAGVNIDMAPLQPSESSDERQARIDQIRARLDDRLRPCTVNITQARWLLGETERLTAELAAAQAREQARTERIKDALDCLPRALDGSRPFSLDQRAEVMLAIEALRAALAGGQGEV